MRRSLHASLTQRFDGDTNALWSDLATQQEFRDGFSKVAKNAKASLVNSRMLPRLNVAVPSKFDSWNPETDVPLVAVMPEGVDDLALETIVAYNSAGAEVLLDAWSEPDYPVLVVGLNERTNDDGSLKSEYAEEIEVEEQLVSRASSGTAYQVHMSVVNLLDDMEPWAKGDAEIAMTAKSRGCDDLEYLDSNWSGLNQSGDSWGPSEPRHLGNSTCDVVFYWWEDDGGAFDFELSVAGFGLGVGMDDADDLIGGKQVAHSTFQGASIGKTTWSALEMWTE